MFSLNVFTESFNRINLVFRGMSKTACNKDLYMVKIVSSALDDVFWKTEYGENSGELIRLSAEGARL